MTTAEQGGERPVDLDEHDRIEAAMTAHPSPTPPPSDGATRSNET